jgi:hypothetical protein
VDAPGSLKRLLAILELESGTKQRKNKTEKLPRTLRPRHFLLNSSDIPSEKLEIATGCTSPALVYKHRRSSRSGRRDFSAKEKAS